ncbi:hypothetical protein F9C07_13403 [Aspergillus flavus]|uniref:Uncharacterized protein n=1 Tax=Aspergillus flavus (strain ATCC 200026 / FGSC A1120 / IAM 13836 / NRRL 3357 / JCM 12722 / SRRC 167) TaxID=332952 RepID=A0A7U2MYA3_ASPFN|nr:hypothetical protein F9C07_13403 [Aspergillus flavus]
MRNGEKKRKRTIHRSQRMRHNGHSDANERLIVYLTMACVYWMDDLIASSKEC